MRHPAWHALLAAMLTAPCCVSVLDLEDYSDVVVELCKCDDVVPQFGGSCVEVLQNRLANASGETRQAWLTFYEQTCNKQCTQADLCYQQKGTCGVLSCTHDNECCGYTESGTVRCIGDACGSCIVTGSPCTPSDVCCEEGAVCSESLCGVPDRADGSE